MCNGSSGSPLPDQQNACYFKTRSNSLKEYELVLTDSHLVFNRPHSTKQSKINYKLESFQCITRNTGAAPSSPLSLKRGKLGKDREAAATVQDAVYCLLMISSPTQQRAIYFTSEEAQMHWHGEILRAQGFTTEHRIDQYESLGPLGEGAFGLVVLSKHKYSDVKVAIKIISKGKIDRAFKATN